MQHQDLSFMMFISSLILAPNQVRKGPATNQSRPSFMGRVSFYSTFLLLLLHLQNFDKTSSVWLLTDIWLRVFIDGWKSLYVFQKGIS